MISASLDTVVRPDQINAIAKLYSDGFKNLNDDQISAIEEFLCDVHKELSRKKEDPGYGDLIATLFQISLTDIKNLRPDIQHVQISIDERQRGVKRDSFELLTALTQTIRNNLFLNPKLLEAHNINSGK